MATKEEERKALAKIQKIVSDLGENSYVGTALDGALDLANQNIDDDAAYSARYYREALYETEEKLSDFSVAHSLECAGISQKGIESVIKNFRNFIQ